MFKHGIFIECPGLFGVGKQFPSGAEGKALPCFGSLSDLRHLQIGPRSLWDTAARAQERERWLHKCAVPDAVPAPSRSPALPPGSLPGAGPSSVCIGLHHQGRNLSSSFLALSYLCSHVVGLQKEIDW